MSINRMRSRTRVTVMKVMVVLMMSAIAPQAFTAINEVRNLNGSPTFCSGTPLLAPGGTYSVMVAGPWQDYARRVSCGTNNCRVSGRVVSTDNSNYDPKAVLALTVPANEPAGAKTIRVSHTTPAGTSTDSFRVNVPAPLLTRITAPSPSQFFNQIALDVRGNGLPSSLSASQLSVNLSLASGDSQVRGGASGGGIVRSSWRRISSTRGTLTIDFREEMKRAVVDVSLRFVGTQNCDVANAGRVRRTVVQTSATESRNYVSRISVASGSARSVGSPLTLNVNLQKRVASGVTLRTGKVGKFNKAASTSLGETVYWRLVPAASFSVGGTTLGSQQRSLVIRNGTQQGRITVQVQACPPGGRRGSGGAVLQTFKYSRSATALPERKDYSFSISCPRNN